MISEQTQIYFRLYEHYKVGVLLKQGGLLDQPHKYLEAMEFLQSRLIKQE